MNNETTPLISASAAIAPSSSKSRKYILITASGMIALLGTGAVLFYAKPGELCAKSPSCGKYLADLIGDQPAYIIFAMGGADFALINAYFSYQSLDKFISSVRRAHSVPGKLLKGSAILTLTALQTLQALFISLGTQSPPWQTIVSVSATVPGNLFGMTSMTEYEIPLLAGFIAEKARRGIYAMRSLCSPVPLEEINLLKRNAFYRQQLNQFRARFRRKWEALSPHVSGLSPSYEDPIEYVFSRPEILILDTPIYDKLGKPLAKLVGATLATTYTAAFYMNSYHFVNRYLNDYVHTEVVPAIAAGYLLASSYYANLTLSMKASVLLLDFVCAILHAKPFHFLPFNLRPKTTLAVFLLASLLSVFSYSLADTIWRNEISAEDTKLNNAFRITADVGISLYHFEGICRFYSLIFSLVTRNPKENFFFSIEKELSRFDRMHLENFIQWVNTNSHEQNDLFEIEKYREMDADQHLASYSQAAASTTSSPINSVSQLPNLKRGSWCCFWNPSQPRQIEQTLPPTPRPGSPALGLGVP